MGQSLLSKYQDEEMRPGHYMPQAMREIGWELHNAATEFTKVAREGDLKQTLVAYHRITSACVACHYSYRTR
jgi:cytochrome c556